MSEKSYVAVIGGMNMDIFGIPDEKVIPRDSNIGQIGMAVGGVGQNIAQNLARLEVPTYLITVYGDDMNGIVMEHSCAQHGIRLDYAEKLTGQRSSGYLYVTDETGDMLLGINDMKICENITPAFLAKRLDFINHASVCMIDANLPEESIKWLGEHVTAPIFVDPVSIVKGKRVIPILDKIDTLKPNRIEAEMMTGIKIMECETAQIAAAKLLEYGVKNVFISLGKDGIMAMSSSQSAHVPTMTTKIVSANGAGDCSTATIVWCRYRGITDLNEVCQYTQAAASIALESEKSVPDITPAKVATKLTQKQLNVQQRLKAVRS